ncbi:MAG: PilZ domain-containing protein [Hyphomicrobiaceae bacterium]
MTEVAVKNRRRFGRRTTFKRALIVPERGDNVQCIAVSWSDGGALLDLGERDCPHDTFNLLLGDDDIVVYCNVVRRFGRKIGVEFLRSPQRASRWETTSRQRAKILVSAVLERDNNINAIQRGST